MQRSGDGVLDAYNNVLVVPAAAVTKAITEQSRLVDSAPASATQGDRAGRDR